MVVHYKLCFILIAKAGKKIFDFSIARKAENLIDSFSREKDIKIIGLCTKANYLQIFVSMRTHISADSYINQLKKYVSQHLQQKFKNLHIQFKGRTIWNRGYFCSSYGFIKEDEINNYIQINVDKKQEEEKKITIALLDEQRQTKEEIITIPLSEQRQAKEKIITVPLSEQRQAKEKIITVPLSEQRQAEEKKITIVSQKDNLEVKNLKKLIRQKEILIQEIHHRVKNNMQLLASLIKLRSRKIDDPKAREFFDETRTRIYSITKIYENVLVNKEVKVIPFGEYIEKLGQELLDVYGKTNQVKLKYKSVQSIYLPFEMITLLGLVANELITNSIKHAFKEEHSNNYIEISVDFFSPKTLQLRFKDNGKGVPENFDFKNSKSIGFELLTGIIEEQLNGSINIIPAIKGTEFLISIDDNRIETRGS